MHQFIDIAREAAGGSRFAVVGATGRSQVAVMNLEPGEASSARMNRHPGEDQILYVLEGSVTAELPGEAREMGPGELIVIPAGTPHRFVNRGDRTVRTFSVYAPPAY